MHVLTLSSPADSTHELRRALRSVAARPTPPLRGLLMRNWRMEHRDVRGRYLFEDELSLGEFLRDASADPALIEVTRLASGPLQEGAIVEHLPPAEVLADPIFIIAAPRSGSTLLYDLLAQSASLWTIDGESEGVIEGIPRLHVANRGFDSHRLDERDAEAETVRTLRAGFLADLRDSRGRRFLETPEKERPARARLLEKTPENSLRVAFLAAAFGSARFVFLHRDARQSVSSIIEGWRHEGFVNIPALPGWRMGRWHFLLPEGWRAMRDAPILDIAAFQWAEANRQAMDDLEAIPKDRWVCVDYSELVATPEPVVRRICDFAGIPVDERMAAALKRPLPVSPTTISPPSPIKWRSNPEFHESALRRYTQVSARLRDLEGHAPPPSPSRPAASLRFCCPLEELRPGPVPLDDGWYVNPSFHFQLGATIPLPLLRRTRFRDRFLADCPLLWVEDAATGVNYPFWIPRQRVHLFRQFVAGRRPPRLDPELTSQLAQATVLVTAEGLERRRREVEAQLEGARVRFAEQRYCELPSLIHPAHVAALSRYYEGLIGSGEWELGDPQVRQRYGQHNEQVARYFHHQLIGVVGRVAGEPVKPSYSYVSAYRGGAALGAHVDRKQCEFTLSLLVEDEESSSADEWPLWFHLPRGKVAVTQRSGDAVLFRGCELPHWRERSSAEHTSTILLFHYVPQDFDEVLD